MKNRILKFFVILCSAIVVLFQLYIAQASDLFGNIYYQNIFELTSPSTGVVTGTTKVGHFYAKNEVLLKFDSSIIKSKIKSLKSKDKLQQLIAQEAKKDLERSKELYEGTMLSEYELKQAEIALLSAQAKRETTQSDLVELNWKLNYLSLKAPFDGFIVDTEIYKGKYIVNDFETKPLIKFIDNNNVNFIVKLSIKQKNSETTVRNFKVGEHFIISNSINAKLVSLKNIYQKSADNNSYELSFDLIEKPLASKIILPKNGSLLSIVSLGNKD